MKNEFKKIRVDASWNHRLYPHAERDWQAKHLEEWTTTSFWERLQLNALKKCKTNSKKEKKETVLECFLFKTPLKANSVQLNGGEQMESCKS